MKSRLGALLILAATSLLFLAVAACNDDDEDESTAEELTLYFDDLADIQRELSDGIEAIDERSQAGFENPPAARQSLDGVQTAGQSALDDVNDLEVPAAAADAHASLSEAGEAYLAALDSLAEELQTVEAGPEYDEFLAGIDDPDSEFQQAKAGLQAACDEMQTVADDNGIVVTLECPV